MLFGLCVLVAIAALLCAQGGFDPAPDGTGGEPAGAIEPAASAPPGPRATSSDRFDADLDDAVAREDVGAVVFWTEGRGLVDSVSDALEAYRDEGRWTLVTSGYIDLKGDVWGALLRRADGPVDMVVATCDAQDAETTVRVARMVPGTEGPFG